MAGITWICWILGSLFLGLGGLWFGLAVFRDRARGRRRCPKCWYDMAGVPGLTCPECGKDGKREVRLSRTRRHRRQAAFAMAVVAVGFLTTRIPNVMEHGVFDVVPTPVLRVVLGFFADDAEAAYLAPSARRVVLSPSLSALSQGSGSSSPFGRSAPAPGSTTTTWRERLEEDWHNLLVASHVRRLIYDEINEGSGRNKELINAYNFGRALGKVGDERRIAFDAMRALACRSDVPTEVRRAGVRWLDVLDFDAAPTRRTLASIARSKSAHASLRLDAIEVLQSMNANSAVYIRALRELLVTPDPESVGQAGYARRAINCAAKLPAQQAVAELLAAIESEQLFTRQVASEGFRQLGSRASSAVPDLIELTHRQDSDIEIYAFESLGGIGGPAVEALLGLMHDADADRRLCIAGVIRRIGTVDSAAMDLIARDLLDGDVPFSRTLLGVARSHGLLAAASLESITVEAQLETRQRFVEMYVGPNLRRNSVVAVAALDDHDREVRVAAFNEIRRMYGAAETISGLVVDTLARATDPRDQRDLISLVHQIGIRDKRMIPLLHGKSWCEAAPNLGFNSLVALDVLCEDREIVIDEAIRLLDDPYERCRILAVRLLWRSGSAAERALPALRAALERDDPPLDEPTAAAIEAISDAIEVQALPDGG